MSLTSNVPEATGYFSAESLGNLAAENVLILGWLSIIFFQYFLGVQEVKKYLSDNSNHQLYTHISKFLSNYQRHCEYLAGRKNECSSEVMWVVLPLLLVVVAV